MAVYTISRIIIILLQIYDYLLIILVNRGLTDIKKIVKFIITEKNIILYVVA